MFQPNWKIFFLFFLFLNIATVISCSDDNNPEVVEDKEDEDDEEVPENEKYNLLRTDYNWIATTDKGSPAQVINLKEFGNFNIQPNQEQFWSEEEIEEAINALLFVKLNNGAGEEIDVTYQVYDGAVKEAQRTVTVKSTSVEFLCDGKPCLDEITLTEPDYFKIVDMNFGSLAQLDNLATYKTFNLDPAFDAKWLQMEVDRALNALLLHHFDKDIGDEVQVTYEIYNGVSVVSKSSDLVLVDSAPFNVIAYDQRSVEKTNNTQTYVHYMPWYESKDHDGYWGLHWTMSNRNPDIIDADGKREIASHYYPTIGPYSSNDPDLVTYHLLLMKLCGIDGVLIDWYGTYDVNDYAQNLINSEALIAQTSDIGIDFGIVYEDRTTENVVKAGRASTAVQAASKDFIYMKNQYFSADNYIRVNGENLLLTFTPVHIESPTQWDQILAASGTDPLFLPLYGQSRDLGDNADGEYSWVTTNSDHFSGLQYFINSVMPSLPFAISSAYPGFKDFYKEGGWGDGFGEIVHNGTSTFDQTLGLSENNHITHVQLVTWNDFGEGTMLEPTIEFGYSLLTEVQQFTGVSIGEEDLKLVEKLYKYRKSAGDDELINLQLDQVTYYLKSLQTNRASALLDKIDVD
ncbi:MAG: hypothetical protein AAFQ94_30260 [Bacteroidota bacterium]